LRAEGFAPTLLVLRLALGADAAQTLGDFREVLEGHGHERS
jgi:hypothetical protein